MPTVYKEIVASSDVVVFAAAAAVVVVVVVVVVVIVYLTKLHFFENNFSRIFFNGKLMGTRLVLSLGNFQPSLF